MFPSLSYSRPHRNQAAVLYGMKLAVVAGAYLLAGKIGLVVPFTSVNVSPVWPSAGIALAALLMWGRWMWPAIAIGAFLVNFVTPVPYKASLGIAVGNTSGAVVAAWLLGRVPGFQTSLTRLRDVLAFVTVAISSSTVPATVGVGALNLAGVRPWSAFASAWPIWWLGDTMGLVLVAPLVLTVYRLPGIRPAGQRLEFATIVLLSIAASLLVFDGRLGVGTADNVLAFLVFPFVIWAAIRFSVPGVAIVSGAIGGIAVWETALGFGPFALPNPVRGATLLQVFLAVISISGMVLAAVTTEREHAEDALQRTQELAQQRKQAEDALRSSEQRLSGIINSAMDAILTVDESQRVVVFNAAAERIFRCTAADAIGQFLDRFIPARFRKIHQRHIRSFGETGTTTRSMYSPGTLYGLRADGHEFPIEAAISQVEMEGRKFYTVILRDITHRMQAEEALMRSEKLASAGRLAATIAHEINNPLAAVTNLLYLAKGDASLSDSARQRMIMADNELKRVAHIAKQTLGFYREQSAPSLVNPAEVLDDVLELLDSKIVQKRLCVERRYRTKLAVLAVPGEIRQVLSNLLSNGIEAVGNGGRITIKVSSSRQWTPPFPRGARITISDTGHGITGENLIKIFEPFFTTKQHAGTGLGLWVSRQIRETRGIDRGAFEHARATPGDNFLSVSAAGRGPSL